MCHGILRDLSLGFVILHVSSPHVAISLLLSSRVEFRWSFSILSSTRQCKQGITSLRNAMEERVQNLKQLRKNQTSNRRCLLASDTAVVLRTLQKKLPSTTSGPRSNPASTPNHPRFSDVLEIDSNHLNSLTQMQAMTKTYPTPRVVTGTEFPRSSALRTTKPSMRPTLEILEISGAVRASLQMDSSAAPLTLLTTARQRLSCREIRPHNWV